VGNKGHPREKALVTKEKSENRLIMNLHSLVKKGQRHKDPSILGASLGVPVGIVGGHKSSVWGKWCYMHLWFQEGTGGGGILSRFRRENNTKILSERNRYRD